MSKDIIKKATGLVHIRSSRQLTLIERKVSNILLGNAYHSLKTQRIFEISVNELMESVGWDSKKDITYFKKVLENLAQTLLQFNVFGKEKKSSSWEIMTLLASAKIKDGMCRYSYSAPLIEKILDSGIYAKLDLEICKKFKNRDAHTLWEFLIECLSSNSSDEIYSPWITIDDFICKVLNKKNKKISFKRINYQYIKKSIEEINRHSNIRVVDTEIEKKNDGVYVRFLVAWENPESPLMDLVDPNYSLVEKQIQEYAKIKATKSPYAYANVVKKSLKNGETTMEAIEEFLQKYHEQKRKKDLVVDTLEDQDFAHEKTDKLFESLSLSEKNDLRVKAIIELKKSGLKSIEKESEANQGLIKQKCIELMQDGIVDSAI
jgi:hypothetical protein